MRYSLVLPCKDEARTIGTCISKARKVLGDDSEIIVVDNNSRDNSASIARRMGARVVHEPVQGYGAALRRGFTEARGDYVIMCDADNTYDILELPSFLKEKADIVIGNRFNNRMRKGSMSFLHRYIGNPLLSLIMRMFFNITTRDTHSGMRVMKRSALKKLALSSVGMELASEMLLKAAKRGMSIKEVPISYSARKGESKLNSFSDGWKHLRLMLLYSPNYLYLIPALAMIFVGMALIAVLMQGPIQIAGVTFQVHPLFIASLLIILGYQILLLWIYSRIYLTSYLEEEDRLLEAVAPRLTLDKGIAIGIMLFILGLALNAYILIKWLSTHLGSLDNLSLPIVGMTVMILGLQTIFASFYLSILGMQNEQRGA